MWPSSGGGRRWPIRWRPGGVANTETEGYPILATKAPGVPDFGHWSKIEAPKHHENCTYTAAAPVQYRQQQPSRHNKYRYNISTPLHAETKIKSGETDPILNLAPG